MFKALGGKVPELGHLSLLAGSEGEGLSKRLGSLNLGELKQEGFESITLSSLLAKIGTSDPMKVFINTDELIKDFDLSKFSRNTAKFDSNDLYNLSLLIDTDLEPKSLLINLKKIEKSMGREDIDGSYSDRFIDIDILFYDNIIIDSEDLKIPHTKIEIRKFVLVPMLEIADDYVHPILNKTIRQLDNECDDQGIPLKII